MCFACSCKFVITWYKLSYIRCWYFS